jgi:hypothetical protein
LRTPIKELVGRKRFDQIIPRLPKQQDSAYDELHLPNMVKVPTTALTVEQRIDGSFVGVNLFPENAVSKL